MSEEQFLRLEKMIGDEYVNKLHSSHVTVAGAGAVGGFAFESLVRSGVGRIRIIDFDSFTLSNLNRQILATHESIGRKKVEVAAERAKLIWPECRVEAVDAFLSEDNYEELTEDTDLVLDCIDSLNPKIGLLEYCVKHSVPVISSMGAALRRDPSLVRTALLKDTWACPLARQVRAGLRKRGVECSIPVVFSPEKVNFSYTPLREEEKAEMGSDRGRRRVVLGSLPTITAIFGETMAHLALKYLTDEALFTGEEAFNPQTLKTASPKKRI
ncbi:MAG: ThiF family adenylyltransferase [Bullifex sp.]